MFPLSVSPPEASYLCFACLIPFAFARDGLRSSADIPLTATAFGNQSSHPWWLNRKTTFTFSSLERRWSSRTFRYGYLVTTSPQLSNLPSAAPSFVRSPTSGIFDSHGVTGGVYKTRERIHRSILICDYYRFQLHVVELQTTIRTETLFLWFAWPHDFASLCLRHCSTCVAQVIRGMMIWRHPHLPPGYPWQSP